MKFIGNEGRSNALVIYGQENMLRQRLIGKIVCWKDKPFQFFSAEYILLSSNDVYIQDWECRMSIYTYINRFSSLGVLLLYAIHVTSW